MADPAAATHRLGLHARGSQEVTSHLNRKSFIPMYFQLAEVLKERIEAGEWEPGARFLSERELCAEFDISRTVVRPALAMLEDDGQLLRIRGRGTFVSPRKTMDPIRGLTRTLATPVPEGTVIAVLDAFEQAPEPYVARTLGMQQHHGTAVAHVTTATAVGGRPLFLRDSFVAYPLAERLLDAVRPRTTLAAGDAPLLPIELGRAQVAIQTSFCSEFEAEQLEIAAGALVILIRCVERDVDGSAIEMARIVYRADIAELAAELA